MPGAFAHIAAVACAGENSALKRLAMPQHAKWILSRNIKFTELGCISPDYPYLDIPSREQAQWADCMHYDNIGNLITCLVGKVKGMNVGPDKEKSFAWLCGFLAHVITDITIHPVVERRVGPYAQNKDAHRWCEMHQDAFIWPKKLALGDIGYADRVRINIGACCDPNDRKKIDGTIAKLWSEALSEVHIDLFAKCAPDVQGWHEWFVRLVDKAEEGHRLFPLARHVTAKLKLTYPMPDEIDDSYISNLDTPIGPMNYEQVFDLAVANIQVYWELIAKAIFDNGSTDAFLNWDLDTGKDPHGNLTAWSQQ